MAKTINTNIDDGFLLFTFTNKQGEVFSSFKLNPTDINIAARAEELGTFFEQAQEYCLKMFLPAKRWQRLISRLRTKSIVCSDTKHLRIYLKNQLPQQLFWKWSGVCLYRSGQNQ